MHSPFSPGGLKGVGEKGQEAVGGGLVARALAVMPARW